MNSILQGTRGARLLLLLAVAALECSLAMVSAADDPAAAARASLERIQAVRKERPGDGLLVFYQALTHVGLGERQPAFELLRSLKGRKLGMIPLRDIGFGPIWEDAEFQKIRKELVDDEPKTPDASVAFRLKDAKLIPEGIAYDPKGKRFFVGSIAQRKIIVSDGKGDARDFSSPSDKLDTVLGLAVDSQRKHLYAVSTNGFLDEAKRERRNAVFRYELKSGRLAERITAADAMQLNDLVITPDGTLYVTDSIGGTLFRKRTADATLTPLGPPGRLRGVNGIALSADGAVYVAASTGIVRVNTESGEPTRLPQPDDVVTGGCDGLTWYEGDLLGVQNSTNPGRVIRIALVDSGNRIAGVTVLQSHHHPEFDVPTTGAVAEGAFHVIARSHVQRYQPDGTIDQVDALKPTAILAIPLTR